ncbi:MAG TPA: 50S ribosomal protein L3 N(5)-glutamine methyltransferase [Burkholderiales bacterium]|nr:50S ribosomal protein L3 N(5)-glutamine methyltransferase [Burkholderiales bacterium]
MWAEAAVQLHTVRDLLRFAVSRFQEGELTFGHGTDNAYDEAAYLILHALRLPLDRLEPFLDAQLLPREVEAVLALLARRVNERIPSAYLTHEAWLGEYRFYVDERVIVPRSHIAEILDQGLDAWVRDSGAVTRALDLCTGSGCLAILLAHAYPAAKVDAVDLSPEALEVAARNVQDYGLEQRVRLMKSDLFSALGRERYDVIVSNPPYVARAAMQTLPPEYRREPTLALSAGEDGMDVVKRILQDAGRHLSRAGVLIVEVGSGRAALEAAVPQIDFTWLETRAGSDLVFLLERGQLPG